jgi:hypothetical protein
MFLCFGRRRAERKRRDERMKTLMEGLLKPDETVRKSPDAKKAIEYCEYCILEYDRLFDENEAKWFRCQKIVIFGGVVATLAGIATVPKSFGLDPYLEGLGWLRGLPAAIVTIAASLMSSFTYREDAVRFELTGNILSNELIKYLGHAKPYNETEAGDTSNFVNKICELVETELNGWRTLVAGSRTPEQPDPDKQK